MNMVSELTELLLLFVYLLFFTKKKLEMMNGILGLSFSLTKSEIFSLGVMESW